MCGIAGIIGRLDGARREALRRMSAAMAHRGPDGEGEWASPPDARGFGVLLAHRRLSILDLSAAGAQPMVDPATGDVTAFNGELYNYVELRRALEASGERFESTGDTAVALRALARAGPAALEGLRGMFALALYDASARTLLLARDPLGIKPLYVAQNPDPEGAWRIAFASEVRALLASGLLEKPRLDAAAVASVVWNGFVAGPGTAVAGVEALPPGELRLFDAAGGLVRAAPFWEARRDPEAAPIGEAELEEALQESVRVHLASDVPLGVFLSSGVDSSAVANLAQRASRDRVHTFTLRFDDPALDEGPIARRIARAIGTDHEEVVLGEDRFVDELDDAIDSLDQPTFDGLNSYYMSRAVRERGFKVALVGTGGDELFGGYTSFRDLPALAAWSRRTRALPTSLRVAAARLLSGVLVRRGGPVPPQTRWAKLPDMVRRGEDLVGLYQLAYALFLPGFQERLLEGAPPAGVVEGLAPALRERLEREIAGRSALSALSVLEQRVFLGERLLRDSDAASMATSLELRLPLVDRVLFEHVDRMSDADRYAPLRSKAALRRIGLRGLDPALFARPKRGFVLPFDRWLRRSLGPVVDRTLRDRERVAATGLAPDAVALLADAFQASARGLYWSRVWAIYAFVRWCHRHRVYL